MLHKVENRVFSGVFDVNILYSEVISCYSYLQIQCASQRGSVNNLVTFIFPSQNTIIPNLEFNRFIKPLILVKCQSMPIFLR